MTTTPSAPVRGPRARLAWTLAVGALAAALAATTVAWAHAVLVRSSPANRAVLTQTPSRVQLWFNERIEPAYARLTVVDVRTMQVDAGDVTVGPDDLRQLSVALPALEAGQYSVRYRVLSVDGHIVEGAVSFTVRPRR